MQEVGREAGKRWKWVKGEEGRGGEKLGRQEEAPMPDMRLL